MDESILVESIKYSAPCQGCGAEAEWCGVQALVDEALRWDVESTWPTCGFALAVCGGDPPEELRGSATLRARAGKVAGRCADEERRHHAGVPRVQRITVQPGSAHYALGLSVPATGRRPARRRTGRGRPSRGERPQGVGCGAHSFGG